MKKVVLEPTSREEGVLVQFTDAVVVDKALTVKVPSGFRAVVYLNEKSEFRIEPTEGKRIVEYGKQYLNATCRVAFIRDTLVPQMLWGFGEINVNNERLKEAYQVGVHGKYSVEIVEAAKLLKGLGGGNAITIDRIREETVPTIRTVGTAILGKYFANTDISVFEIAAHQDEIREKLITSLKNETVFASLGLNLRDLTVDKVRIQDEDLELIRQRINNGEDKTPLAAVPEATPIDAGEPIQPVIVPPAQDSSETLDAISKIAERLDELEKALKANREEKKPERSGFDADLSKLREELEHAITARLDEAARELEKTVGSKVERGIGKSAELWKDTLLAGLDEKLQELTPVPVPQTNEPKRHDFSAEGLIRDAVKDGDLVAAAAVIYTNVEDNLINSFGLEHRNKKFVISYDEYLSLAESATVNGAYILKYGNEPLRANVIEQDPDGKPTIVEMLPVVRYLKAGLSPEDAKHAEEIGTVINKIRHPSPENKRFLTQFFGRRSESMKEYLADALAFLKSKKLYVEK